MSFSLMQFEHLNVHFIRWVKSVVVSFSLANDKKLVPFKSNQVVLDLKFICRNASPLHNPQLQGRI